MALILKTHQKLWRICTAKTSLQPVLSRLYSKNATGQKPITRRLVIEKVQGHDYPIKDLIPVAEEVLKARAFLIKGVSTLLQSIPVWSCMHCQEVHIGEQGHLIKSCCGFRRRARGSRHEWVKGKNSLNDIIIPVDASQIQNTFKNVSEFKKGIGCNFHTVPAVVELCLEAGAYRRDEGLVSSHLNFDRYVHKCIGGGALSPFVGNAVLSVDDRKVVAQGTIGAWETVRSGVEQLLSAYPIKVYKHYSGSLVGPSGRRPRVCDVFKIQTYQWSNVWVNAKVDDLVPPKVVRFQQLQDSPLLNAHREFYGRAPAVIDLCTKAGAIPPSKYLHMMKLRDFSVPSPKPELEED
ncbi:APO protein 4, mitochondrial [Heracleum sosnowskyi]|uniref:APO protein 4, mitochondrial n=1 Tax=Heracleum sosnowskyi TaxID=360622 RepID=A0AAD8IWJ9_9APIA|nr:APO protein 4, mitochondrial [Heracleum sosnowskyi]